MKQRKTKENLRKKKIKGEGNECPKPDGHISRYPPNEPLPSPRINPLSLPPPVY